MKRPFLFLFSFLFDGFGVMVFYLFVKFPELWDSHPKGWVIPDNITG